MATFTGKDITIYYNIKDTERANPGFMDYINCRSDAVEPITCFNTEHYTFFDDEQYGNPDDLPLEIFATLAEVHGIIDVDKYYNDCCIEVIGVQSKKTNKRSFIRIAEGEKKINYYINPHTRYWFENSDTREDSFIYFVKNVETGEIAWGTIYLKSESQDEDFVAEDIFITLKAPLPKLLEINIPMFNPLHPSALISKIGYFDRKFFTNVQLAPDNNSALQFTINQEGCSWDCCNVMTDVEYWLSNTETGGKNKARIYFRKDCEGFEVNDILIEISGAVPAYTNIDVQSYNDHADIDVINLQQIPAERGTHEIVSGQDDDVVKYTFNTSSGYWSPSPKEDMFRYTAIRADGAIASAYIRIKKIASGSGSGSGSGKGSGGSTMLYFNSTANNIITIDEISFSLPSGANPYGYYLINLVSISSISLKGFPGTHTITGGYIRIDIIVPGYTYKITILSGPPLLNAVAPVQQMVLFVSSAVSPIAAGTTWLVNILEENPMNSGDDSRIEIA